MKEIRAYIQPHKINQLTMALTNIPGFPGMSVSDCSGFGRNRTDQSQDYKPFIAKKRIEIFAPDEMVDVIFETIMKVAQSKHHGDGKVFIINTLEGGRISTGERGPEVV
ncbi:P-II family nitrogen regulator [Methylomonas sp. AM2-LC]|uniref:P-II family nitrogen regulator n=1 Tax=Methylomonas sp. AM2-LC TaxID=3153301 RepID=UPI003267DAAF